jgi:GNAT superfamily N-acetyltransferase
MSKCTWRILPMEARHINEAGNVHQAAFPGFFLSFLGPRFLRELYRAFALADSGVALVVEDPSSGELLGVVAGTLDPQGFFRRLLLRRWWAFGFWSLPALAKEPKALVRVLRALSYRGDSPEDKKRALLSSIAVAPQKQGTGLGSFLLNEWVARARDMGALGCYLTTDALGNDAVNRFYLRNGWRIASEFATPKSRMMRRYVLDWE